MSMATSILVYLCYLSATIFVAAVAVRCFRLARMPIHLRWELHPVAHERNAAHGGSRFEHLGWWAGDRPKDRIRPLVVMLAEILLLRGVYQHDRRLWLRSYPFHLGLYLLAGFVALLVMGALPSVAVIVGIGGFVLLGLGAGGLLLRRLFEPALRAHSAPADLLNLALFVAAASLGLLAFFVSDRDFAFLGGFLHALATRRAAVAVPIPVGAEIVMGGVILAYVPLTHMSHFFTKWFMYHGVLWNDRVNRVGSRLEAKLVKQLHAKATWNAAHIRAGAGKSWVEIATEEASKP